MTDKQKAIIRYSESDIEKEDQSPLERLRFFCQLAMSGDDWVDAGHFFDSLALQVLDKVDVGPWSAGATTDGRAYLESSDFTHDVRLYVDGDFACPGDKLNYAQGIAGQLNAAPVSAEPVAWVRRHPDGALTAEFLEHAVIEPVRKNSGAWVPLYTAPVAAQAQPSSDRAMLLKLMAAFDMEVWNCPNCTAAEETKDCDSAIMLREYLSNNPVIAQQPVSGDDGLDERKDFEAWAVTQTETWLIVGGLTWSPGTGDYASARTNAAWAAWQARAALAQKTVSGDDVTPQNVADALDLMDAILAPERGLLAVPYTSATVTAAREDLALIRTALAQQDADKNLVEMVHAMFRSGNDVPVTRITIDRNQYEAAVNAARKEQE